MPACAGMSGNLDLSWDEPSDSPPPAEQTTEEAARALLLRLALTPERRLLLLLRLAPRAPAVLGRPLLIGRTPDNRPRALLCSGWICSRRCGLGFRLDRIGRQNTGRRDYVAAWPGKVVGPPRRGLDRLAFHQHTCGHRVGGAIAHRRTAEQRIARAFRRRQRHHRARDRARRKTGRGGRGRRLGVRLRLLRQWRCCRRSA